MAVSAIYLIFEVFGLGHVHRESKIIRNLLSLTVFVAQNYNIDSNPFKVVKCESLLYWRDDYDNFFW